MMPRAMNTPLYAAAMSLLAAAPLSAAPGPHLVFAHYMVCIPRAGGDATVADYEREIRDAQARGIDGFALNCGGWTLHEPHYEARTLLIYEAAKQLGTGFKLFLSADYSTGLTLEETRDMIATFRDHPNQFRWQGKPVLSTFAGEGADNSAGRALIAYLDREFPDGKRGHDVCFVPYFYPRPNITEIPRQEHVDQVFRDFPGLDGYFYFGAAGTGPALAEANGLLADKWTGAGKVFMASVTPYYRGFGGNFRCYETRGFEGMAAEWEAAIRHRATWVEIVTWNDWGEASYVCPFGAPADTELWDGHWGRELSHTAYLDASRYYIQWFKTGTPPPIPRDELYYFYRPHPKAAQGRIKPDDPALGRPGGADALHDSVFVTCFLKAPARLTIHSGDTAKSFDLSAGVHHVEAPFALGRQRFVLERDGKVVIDKIGEHDITKDAWADFNMFGGSAAGL
jgi:glucan endo-1,3-alpha-glucosidase